MFKSSVGLNLLFGVVGCLITVLIGFISFVSTEAGCANALGEDGEMVGIGEKEGRDKEREGEEEASEEGKELID